MILVSASARVKQDADPDYRSRSASGIDPFLLCDSGGLAENWIASQQFDALDVPLCRNRHAQANGSANTQPLQRLGIIRLDPDKQLSFGVATGYPNGECLHPFRAGCATHVSNRAPRPRYVCDNFGIRTKRLRHRASAREHQRAVVRLQIVLA